MHDRIKHLFFSNNSRPPGTGKTKTIIGIVGMYFSQSGSLKVQPSDSTTTDKPPAAGDIATLPLHRLSELFEAIKKTTLLLKSVEAPLPPKIPRILVCAPSNAAVDELVSRLMNGFPSVTGETMHPSIVRLGRLTKVKHSVLHTTLHEIVEKEMYSVENLNKLRDALFSRKTELQLRAEQDTDTTKMIKDITQCTIALATLIKKNDKLRNIKSIITLQRANIVACTLSGTATAIIKNAGLTFDTVIIDEAAQSTELTSLIPLKHGCTRCIIVGDPKQLPPTVFSQRAIHYGYRRSLFERIFQNHQTNSAAGTAAVFLLDTQYRMHPHISQFPQREFYNGKLKNCSDMETLRLRNWHTVSGTSGTSTLFGTFQFWNVANGEHQRSKFTKSLYNLAEVDAVYGLYCLFVNDFHMKHEPSGRKHLAGRIGIISPYREQVNQLKAHFTKMFGKGILTEVEFSTVDKFQGQEKDIIIISCVRAVKLTKPDGKIGFFSDTRRMNVALTRAMSSLWILGHETTLSSDKVWMRLCSDARERGVMSEVTSKNYFNRKKLRKQVRAVGTQTCE